MKQQNQILRHGTRALLWAVLLLAVALRTAPAQPVQGSTTLAEEQRGMEGRVAQKLALAKANKYDLVLVGDSITHNLDNGGFKEKVWDPFYAPRHALNLGFSGARTQNILWDLEHGLLEGQSPKVALLLIGTNNSDEVHFPQHCTAEDIAAGIVADVQKLRAKAPGMKIILLRILPFGERPNPRRAMNDRASDLAAAQLVDWKNVYFCDVNHVFLNLDRTVKKDLMPDFLHPSPEGALRMAQEIEPLLAQLLGDTSKAPVNANNAVVPAPKLENDFYDWWGRHQDELDAKKTIKPQVVMIGDSITHMWGGPPKSNKVNGAAAWKELFGEIPALNLGFGWDRTQNVLWRLDHGEFDGLHPKVVVLTIGVNNFSGTRNARASTPEEASQGILAIVGRVRSKSPETRIIVMGVLPAGQQAADPRRAKIKALNALVAQAVAGVPDVTFLDLGAKLLEPDGSISRATMGDFLHPTEKGYSIWAKALIEAGIRNK